MNKHPQPDTAPVLTDLAEAAQWLRRRGVAEAAVLRAELPQAWGFVKTARVEDFATLKRQAAATGAVIATGAEAADVSHLVGQLRRRAAMMALLPSAKAEDAEDGDTAAPGEGRPQRLCLDIDEALRVEGAARAEEPEAAAEKKPESPAEEEPKTPTAEEAAQAPASHVKEGAESPAAEAAEKPASPVAEDPAPSPDAPAAETLAPAQPTPAAPAGKDEGPVFVLLIDSLAAVPALADLPGAQPDVAVVGAVSASAEDVTDALRMAHACATDTLWEKRFGGPVATKAKNVLTRSRALLEGHSADAGQAAALLLERGHEGGYAFLLGTALSQRYGLPLGEAAEKALPGLQQAMEGTSPAPGAKLPMLRLRDVPALASAARRPRRAMARTLTAEELAQALRTLYVPMDGPAAVEELLPRQRAFFQEGLTRETSFRLSQLAALAAWVDAHEAQIESALRSDLGKCAFEAYETEILLVKEELRCARRNLWHWQRDRRVRMPLMHWPASGRVVREPYGCALIMAPWNYPFLLSVDPLIAALAAGDCAVLKPSAYAPATSSLLREMVEELFDPEYVAVVEGGRAENQSLLAQAFDVIFFTGSVAVGKTVMRAAAEHLTPVTLELGGKSPCIVDDTADVALAARRIAWGKLINAGQTCVAPDYVVCSPEMAPKLEKELARAIRRMYGQTPLNNPELCRIVNQRHFQRLTGLLEGADIALGGRGDSATLKLEPTVVRGVSWDDPLMQEEIFGPILPILPYDGDFDSLLRAIEARPRPLAAYLFTRDKAHEAAFLRRLCFGGGCINDVVCHLATSRMPFGGVGESGMGSYHGRRGFEAFSHEKSILKKSRRVDVPVRYAPYGEKKIRLLRKL